MSEPDGQAWVCTDCYFAHHYGAYKVEREATEAEADMYRHGYHDRELMGLEFLELDAGLQVTEWFSGESDTCCEGGEPLSQLRGCELADSTCSDHYYGQTCETNEDGEYTEPCLQCGSSDDENGIQEFSWSWCQGCGSHLGGSRHRLTYWIKENA